MKAGMGWGKRISGFTLIELMIAVAILGILASIALPSYRQYVLRGKIPDATSHLASKRVQMEQFFQDAKTYVGTPLCPVVPAPDTTTSKNFTFDCDGAPTPTTFKLRATGTGTMAGFVYTVDQSNNKVTVSVPSGWTASPDCWVTAKSGAC
jgi:type IV pilus assembly protein PilE